MKVTITRSKMLATLKKSQAQDLKNQQAEIAKKKKEHDKRVGDAIAQFSKQLADLKSKGTCDSVGGVYPFDPDNAFERRYHGALKVGETQYDPAIAFVEACEDTEFVLDVAKDKSGLSQIFFAALKR